MFDSGDGGAALAARADGQVRMPPSCDVLFGGHQFTNCMHRVAAASLAFHELDDVSAKTAPSRAHGRA